MRFVAAMVLAMISTSCMSTKGARHEMRAAAFAVPTFDEDREQGEETSDDSASLWDPCDSRVASAGECVQRTTSVDRPSPVKAKNAR